jgi:hypothetical protein
MNFIYSVAKKFIWNKFLKSGFENLHIKSQNYFID